MEKSVDFNLLIKYLIPFELKSEDLEKIEVFIDLGILEINILNYSLVIAEIKEEYKPLFKKINS